MTKLLDWFVSAFAGVFKLWGVTASHRAALVLIYIAAYVAIAVAFAASINGLFSGITLNIPSNSLLLAGLSLVPAKATLYLTMIATAHAFALLYIWKQRLLKIKVKTK